MPPVFGILSRCRSIIVSAGAVSSRVILFGASKAGNKGKTRGPRQMDHTTSRREFLTTSGAAAAVVMLDSPAFGALGASSSNSPSWVDRPMRWAQLTLVEDDPGQFDPDFWLDYFKRTKSD